MQSDRRQQQQLKQQQQQDKELLMDVRLSHRAIWFGLVLSLLQEYHQMDVWQ